MAAGADGRCWAPAGAFALDDRAPTFGKIKLALAACAGRDDYWLLWTDADALVVNQSVPLTRLVDDAYDILASKDWFMLNAGVLLLRCSAWNVAFLSRVYAASQFDNAVALDQSALAEFMDAPDAAPHVKWLPKWAMNVYTEEYRPGDFLVHLAGKLYEATPTGTAAIARQLDVFSRTEDVSLIEAFFDTRYLLGSYSGTCVVKQGEGARLPAEGQAAADARRAARRLVHPRPVQARAAAARVQQGVDRRRGRAGRDGHQGAESCQGVKGGVRGGWVGAVVVSRGWEGW